MTFRKYTYIKSLHGHAFPSDLYYRVLVTLLDYANKDGDQAHPGNDRLASDCRCHVESVKKIIRKLTKDGYIILVSQGRRQAGASVYRFPDEAPSKEARGLPCNENPKEVDGRSREVAETVSAGSQGSARTSPSKELSRGFDPKGSKPHQEDAWKPVPELVSRSDGLTATGNSFSGSVSHVGSGLRSERPSTEEWADCGPGSAASGEYVAGLWPDEPPDEYFDNEEAARYELVSDDFEAKEPW